MGCDHSRATRVLCHRKGSTDSTVTFPVATPWHTAKSRLTSKSERVSAIADLPTAPQSPTVDDCLCGFVEHETLKVAVPVALPCGGQQTLLERIILAESLCGRWETLMERSESLNDIYVHLGLNMAKRAVMNRLKLQIQVYLDYKSLLLTCLLYTPLGVRDMKTLLTGKESIDDDADCGRWKCYASATDAVVAGFCTRPVRCITQRRYNDAKGMSVETRVVLPDAEHGIVMRTELRMYPNPTDETSFLKAVRYLKKTGPVDPSLRSTV